MEIKDFGRVGVLMGGPSSEREISFKSGKAVLNALKESGVEAVEVDISTDDRKENARLLKSFGLDCAFIALHGRFGEDGTVQEILEGIGLVYTGSGIESSRLAMDKIGSLKAFRAGGLNVPGSVFLEKGGYPGRNSARTRGAACSQAGEPWFKLRLDDRRFRKPAQAAIEEAFRYDERIIIEEYIRGRELTVGVLDETALPVVEIVPKHKFFDFEAKYQAGLTEYIVPARLCPETAERIQQSALSAHKILGCSGCSRTDIIMKEDGPLFLEQHYPAGPPHLFPKLPGSWVIDLPAFLKLLNWHMKKQKFGYR
jgi:D-alanine-D-alanine ligase